MKTSWNPWFYFPFVIALIAGGVLLTTFEKGQDVIFVNSFHSPALDNLFYYGTTLGNGLLYLLFGIALSWKNFRLSLIAILSFSITGLLVQFFKKVIFSEVVRPNVLLAGEPLHFVEGVKILARYSFPSGHSAIAFSLFCFVSLMVKEKKWGIVFLLMALIGGISRIYLVQHFFVDVYCGAILGVVVTSLVWLWFMKTTALQSLSDKSLSTYLRR